MSNSLRIIWRLRHEALKTIYNGAILPQLLYAVPVSIDAIKNEYNTKKYVKVQRIISLRVAKAYRTIYHEAISILTGLTPITFKGEDVATLYNITTGRYNKKYQTDKEDNPSSWLHPADMFSLNNTKEEGEEYLWHNFTSGSKSEKGVGSGVAILQGGYSRNNSNST